MKKRQPSKLKDQRQEQAKFNPCSTATEAQIQRLQEALHRRPHNTHELRRMGISHPAGRIQDLEKRGYVIESARTTTVDSDGFTHSGVALYALIAEPESNGGCQ